MQTYNFQRIDVSFTSSVFKCLETKLVFEVKKGGTASENYLSGLNEDWGIIGEQLRQKHECLKNFDEKDIKNKKHLVF